jgi:GT2 family glycosyltransferase
MRDASQPSLVVHLDLDLPETIEVGGGTAVFVCGWAFHPQAATVGLWFVLDGERQPVAAFGMPRLDPFAELHPGLDPYEAARLPSDPDSASDPDLRSYPSGFWGLVRIVSGAAQRRELTLELEARLADVRVVSAPLGELRPARPGDDPRASAPEMPAGEEPAVAICMATHNPPSDLLETQLDSIREQSHHRWVCLISDDASSGERFAALQQAVGDDPRFVISRSARRLGFYRNFERALRTVPAEAEFVALSDQDDRWHPDKLATLLRARGDAALVYSDARLVTRDGTVLADTYWGVRTPNHHDLLSLLVANSVSGAATLLRRDLLEVALPFPPDQFSHYHDHWLALVALAQGEIGFVARPLYDYVQHGGAVLGHDAANQMPGLRQRLTRRDRRGQIRLWRMHYFVDVWRLQQCIAILEMRLGERIAPERRRILQRFAAADDSWASLAQLGYRGLRELAGRGQTLGAEWMLFCAFGWRRLLNATARPRPQPRWRLDSVPPPDLAPRPRRAAPGGPAVRAIADKIAPLELAVSHSAPVRINLLVPTVDLEHFFGGYIGKFNLAVRLAHAGVRVRVVTVDPTGRLPRGWRTHVEAYAGLQGAFDAVEVAFGREQAPLPVSPRDRFIATTWWTAHIAGAAVRTVDGGRFLYLIQEYEPFTFPMGTLSALAEQSYAIPHFALFSSELLRGYFRAHKIGVYAGGDAQGDAASQSFQNAITAVSPPTIGELRTRERPRLLFYARSEPHAARNLFELGVMSLIRAVADGALAGWEINGIGSLQGGEPVDLGEGALLRLLPRTDQRSYAQVLRDHDVGLALMYTPHPSLVPMEMASAGLLTVTSSFENKTAQAVRDISANLTAVEPRAHQIADALVRAVHDAGDFERRIAGSQVRWSSDWAQSFDDELVARLIAELDVSA